MDVGHRLARVLPVLTGTLLSKIHGRARTPPRPRRPPPPTPTYYPFSFTCIAMLSADAPYSFSITFETRLTDRHRSTDCSESLRVRQAGLCVCPFFVFFLSLRRCQNLVFGELVVARH